MSSSKTISIIGGGCAGYSLLNKLKNVSNIEIDFFIGKNQGINNFWGYWEYDKDIPDNILSGKWNKWKISTQDGEKFFESSSHPYCVTTRHNWISYCKQNTNKKNIRILKEDIMEINNKIYNKNNDEIISDFIFDSRYTNKSKNIFLQHFKGFLIKTETDCFDDEVLTLMDFRCDQSKGMQFVYVLPFTKKIALIEPTIYSYNIEDEIYYKKTLESYLYDIYKIKKYNIIKTEKGSIPLEHNNIKKGPYFNIGINGNVNRKSSGYTFTFIQKQSILIKNFFSNTSNDLSLKVQSKFFNFLDEIFLDVIKRKPSIGPLIFYSFGKSFNGNEMSDFMNNRINFIPFMKMLFNLPFKEFIKSFIRCLFNYG